jgi:hypothetical protein
MLIDQYISFSEEDVTLVLLMLSFTWLAVYQQLKGQSNVVVFRRNNGGVNFDIRKR